ncbi:DUF4282 domain-containing protein [Humidisolicoccus flavus]|uniref:DUF4282 domain-containing protein n=1 Tax=Humidisolicoccus flavus TaxID=3111414 RepID=UPI00324FF266
MTQPPADANGQQYGQGFGQSAPQPGYGNAQDPSQQNAANPSPQFGQPAYQGNQAPAGNQSFGNGQYDQSFGSQQPQFGENQQGWNAESQGWNGQQYAPAPAAKREPGVFGALFDFKLTQHVTPKIARLVYLLGVIGISLGALLMLIFGFLQIMGGVSSMNSMYATAPGGLVLFLGVITILATPLVAFLQLAWLRITIEFFTVQFTAADDIRQLREASSK